MKMSYSYPGMRLDMVMFVVPCDKVIKVMYKRQIKIEKWRMREPPSPRLRRSKEGEKRR
jgi:hypothetical protein